MTEPSFMAEIRQKIGESMSELEQSDTDPNIQADVTHQIAMERVSALPGIGRMHYLKHANLIQVFLVTNDSARDAQLHEILSGHSFNYQIISP